MPGPVFLEGDRVTLRPVEESDLPFLQRCMNDPRVWRLAAEVGSFNDASVALLESLGFEHEGTRREAAWHRGEYHDMLAYGLLRAEW